LNARFDRWNAVGDARIQFAVSFEEAGKFRVVSKKKVREKDQQN